MFADKITKKILFFFFCYFRLKKQNAFFIFMKTHFFRNKTVQSMCRLKKPKTPFPALPASILEIGSHGKKKSPLFRGYTNICVLVVRTSSTDRRPTDTQYDMLVLVRYPYILTYIRSVCRRLMFVCACSIILLLQDCRSHVYIICVQYACMCSMYSVAAWCWASKVRVSINGRHSYYSDIYGGANKLYH